RGLRAQSFGQEGLGRDGGRLAEAIQNGADRGLGRLVEHGTRRRDVLAQVPDQIISPLGRQISAGVGNRAEIILDEPVQLINRLRHVYSVPTMRSTAVRNATHSDRKWANASLP